MLQGNKVYEDQKPPKGQPHKVHCLETGVVFVSYEGNPDITPIAEHDA